MTSGAAQPPVAVVGAGIAGLVAARDLHRRGIPVVVFEAGKAVAGLAATHRDTDGYTYDTGAHFITNRLAREIGVLDQCRRVRHYGETVVLGDKSYGYPFGLLRVPRFVRSAVTTKLERTDALKNPVTAADWFRSAYGRALADEVALPLLEAWSGAPADQLSRAVGDKIPGGMVSTMALKTASRVSKRAIAVGYCREMPQSPKVWHVYPEGGVSTLCEHVAAELDGAVRLETPVQSITVENGKAVAIEAGGEELETSAVISTAPVHVLPKLVNGDDSLDRFQSFRYRPMIFINMRFRGRGYLPDVVTWTPEERFPFFRLTETTLSMPWHAPAGHTLVMADIGAEVGDEYWTMDDDDLGLLCLEHLGPIIPDAKSNYLGCKVVRTPIAYPVFRMDYEADRQALEESTGVDRLLSVGRNGEFAHILMEDVYWRTLRQVNGLAVEMRHTG
jgi:protoporphyrinogen oxidase